MSITSTKRGNVLVVAPQELDRNNVADVEATLADYIEQGEAKIILDLSNVPYISSMGLRVILKTITTMMKKNGKVCLCGGNDQVLNVLRLSGGMVMALHSPGLPEAIEKIDA